MNKGTNWVRPEDNKAGQEPRVDQRWKKILMERSSGQLVLWAAEVGVLQEKTGFQPHDRGSALKEPARSVSSPS